MADHWRVFGQGQKRLARDDGACIGEFRAPADAARAVACVNACDGLLNPVEEIEAMRVALIEIANLADLSSKDVPPGLRYALVVARDVRKRHE